MTHLRIKSTDKVTSEHPSYKLAPNLFSPAGLTEEGVRLFRLKSDINDVSPPESPHWRTFRLREPLPDGFEDQFFGDYLEIIALKGCTLRAARELGHDYTVIDRLVESLPSLTEAVDNARAEFVSRVRAAVVDRALVGFKEPLVHQGRVVEWIVKIDTSALAKLATIHVPEFKPDGTAAQNTAGVLILPPVQGAEEWAKNGQS